MKSRNCYRKGAVPVAILIAAGVGILLGGGAVWLFTPKTATGLMMGFFLAIAAVLCGVFVHHYFSNRRSK